MAQYTKAILAKKSKADLAEIADELDIDTEDLTKPQLIEAILEVLESDEEEDDEVDDTEADDELDDIEEPELDDEEEEEDEVDEEPVKKTRTKKTTKKTTTEGEADTLAAKQVAALLNTDAKTIRQFFRSPASTTEAVGSGGRYEFLESDVPQIKSEFDTWFANRGKRAAAGTGTKKSRKAAAVTEVIEEVEEIEELEEAELDDLDEDDIELDD